MRGVPAGTLAQKTGCPDGMFYTCFERYTANAVELWHRSIRSPAIHGRGRLLDCVFSHVAILFFLTSVHR